MSRVPDRENTANSNEEQKHLETTTRTNEVLPAEREFCF